MEEGRNVESIKSAECPPLFTFFPLSSLSTAGTMSARLSKNKSETHFYLVRVTWVDWINERVSTTELIKSYTYIFAGGIRFISHVVSIFILLADWYDLSFTWTIKTIKTVKRWWHQKAAEVSEKLTEMMLKRISISNIASGSLFSDSMWWNWNFRRMNVPYW